MKTVLIVEPDPASSKLLAVVLAKVQLTTHVVSSAEDALKMLASFRFHVVITELDLPLLGGLSLIETIRNTRSIRATPIVVATANHDADTRRRAELAGCQLFIAKPVEVSSFGARVLRLVEVPT